jgi:hypothetical protein
MKAQADKKRTERHFAERDLVYLKLMPYMQKSVADQGKRKLAFRYYGPFQVLQKVGKVAYKLALPPSSQIHPVIHVSQLKKAIGANIPVSLELPQLGEDMAKPDMVLGTRLQPTEVLVRWQGLPDALATWENKEDMHHRFPEFPAWGQAGSQEEGNVMDLTNDVAFSATGKQRRRLRRAEGSQLGSVGPNGPNESQLEQGLDAYPVPRGVVFRGVLVGASP